MKPETKKSILIGHAWTTNKAKSLIFCGYMYNLASLVIKLCRGMKFSHSETKFSKYFSNVTTQVTEIPIFCSTIDVDRIQTDGFLLLFVQIRCISDCILRIESRREIFTFRVKTFQIFLKCDHTGDRNSNFLIHDRRRSNPNWWFFVTICSNSLHFWLYPQNWVETWNFWRPKSNIVNYWPLPFEFWRFSKQFQSWIVNICYYLFQ